MERARPLMYLIVIALAFTLPTWMAVIQAAMGGIGLGFLLGRHAYRS